MSNKNAKAVLSLSAAFVDAVKDTTQVGSQTAESNADAQRRSFFVAAEMGGETINCRGRHRYGDVCGNSAL